MKMKIIISVILLVLISSGCTHIRPIPLPEGYAYCDDPNSKSFDFVPECSKVIKIPVSGILGNPLEVNISFADINEEKDRISVPKVTFTGAQATVIVKNGYFLYEIDKKKMIEKFKKKGHHHIPAQIGVTVEDLPDTAELGLPRFWGRKAKSNYFIFKEFQGGN